MDARRQVVTLVEDDEAETVAHPLHEAEGRGVGRDRERARLEVAAADEPDLRVEAGEQEVVPLVHQIERRHDDERRALHLLDRHLRDEALARARREHDDAAVARALPLLDRLLLVRARLDEELGREVEAVVGARVVFVRRSSSRTNSLTTCRYSHAGARQRITRASQRKASGTRASAPAPSSSSVPASNRRTSVVSFIW